MGDGLVQRCVGSFVVAAKRTNRSLENHAPRNREEWVGDIRRNRNEPLSQPVVMDLALDFAPGIPVRATRVEGIQDDVLPFAIIRSGEFT